MVILEAQADLLSAQDVKLLCFDPKVSEEFCRAPLLGDFHRMLTRLLSDTHMHVRSDSLCCCTCLIGNACRAFSFEIHATFLKPI